MKNNSSLFCQWPLPSIHPDNKQLLQHLTDAVVQNYLELNHLTVLLSP